MRNHLEYSINLLQVDRCDATVFLPTHNPSIPVRLYQDPPHAAWALEDDRAVLIHVSLDAALGTQALGLEVCAGCVDGVEGLDAVGAEAVVVAVAAVISS